MHCIKTGFTIFIRGMNKYTRMDLFYDLQDLYSNQNDFYDGKPNVVDIECDDLEWKGDYYKIINPTINKRLIEYVDTMPYKGNGYDQLEFITKNVLSVESQERLIDQLCLSEDEVAELLTSFNNKLYLEKERRDRNGSGFQTVYIEQLDLV